MANSYEDQKTGAGQNTSSGLIGDALNRQFQNQAARSNLRERIVSRAFHAQQEAHKGARLQRLIELFDKHPDICEIIDLITGLELL